MKAFITVCIIAKNEEKVIGRCLESIKECVEEIIVVDTGSSDKTKKIALEYTDLVFDFPWVNDFSKARNYAASKASGKWILVLDADEFIDRNSFLSFKEKLLTNSEGTNIFAVQIVNFLGSNANKTALNYHERIYKNDGLISYYRSIHEMLRHRNSQEKREISDFQIFHSGYMRDTIIEKDKSNRNLSLLKNKKEKEPIDYYFLGNEYYNIEDYGNAIKCYQTGFQLKPGLNYDWVIKLLIRLINCLHDADRDEEALLIADSGIELFPQLVDLLFIKGKIFYDKNKYNDALKVFESILNNKDILKADSSNDYLELLPHTYLGEIYQSQGNLHSAVHHYSKALSFNDSDEYIWMKLIFLLSNNTSEHELVSFISNNMMKRRNMTNSKLLKILLSVPNINVQRLSYNFLKPEDVELFDMESLKWKKLMLYNSYNDLLKSIKQKNINEITFVISKGYFSLIDLILTYIYTKDNGIQEILYKLKLNVSLKNLLNLITGKKCKKLAKFDEEIIILLYKQACVLEINDILKEFNKKLSLKTYKNIKNELSKYNFSI